MTDVAGFGLSVQLIAIPTFAIGLDITQFSDDSDPLDSEAIDIASTAMGLNGDLITWSSANPIALMLNIIPGSEDDKDLAALFEANRPGRTKGVARDIITAIVSYPDLSTHTLAGGVCVSFVPVKSVASEGRLKTRPYGFSFESGVPTL